MHLSSQPDDRPAVQLADRALEATQCFIPDTGTFLPSLSRPLRFSSTAMAPPGNNARSGLSAPLQQSSTRRCAPMPSGCWRKACKPFATIRLAARIFGAVRARCTQASKADRFGGVGPGVSPKQALELGLKVDMEAVPPNVAAAIKAGRVDLNDPANTLLLLKANAVVGVTGFFNPDGKSLKAVGIQCALCHSTV